MSEMTTDFLVIGSGLAGLLCALKLAAKGPVTVVTKAGVTDTSSVLAQGGIAAALAPGDSPRAHAKDTLAAGAGLCDHLAVKTLVKEGPARISELINLGVRFDHDAQGQLALGREGAHQQNRIVHVSDHTGLSVHKVVLGLVLNNPNIRLIENCPIVALRTTDGQCWGATSESGVVFTARAIVLATGGAGQLFRNTSNSVTATGDGLLLGYEAGADLIDLEFFQFHPTGFLLPVYETAAHLLISEAVRGEGARLRNVYRQAFVDELAPRDIVTRAIFQEMKKTNSTHVLLDMTVIGNLARYRFPTIYRACQQVRVNITKDVVPVAPLAHYYMGGLKTDLEGRTNIDGLYALGECACTGVDGANRLASNSLLAALVFAERAARDIASRAWQTPPSKKILAGMARRPMHNPAILFQLQSLLWNYVGIERSKESLETARDLVGIMPKNMAVVKLAQLMIESALAREESRGAHYRTDFPHKSSKGLYRLVHNKERGLRVLSAKI